MLIILLRRLMLDRIRAEMERIDWRQAVIDVLLWIVSLPFYLAGWIVGFTVFCILWFAASVVTGFKDGMRR